MPIPLASTTTPPSTLVLANDSVVVNSFATGANTNAWAIRDSSIDVSSGDDYVSLNARPSKPNAATTLPMAQKTLH